MLKYGYTFPEGVDEDETLVDDAEAPGQGPDTDTDHQEYRLAAGKPKRKGFIEPCY